MTRLEKIASMYSALTGDANVTPEEIHVYAGLSETVTLEAISASITADSVLNFEAMPVNDLLDYMFINLFDYTADEVEALRATDEGAAGFQYWADELANNSAMINVNTIAIALLNGAGAADDAAAAAKVADAVAEYEAAYDDDAEPSTPGETFMLTEGRDNLDGTSGDDTFVGDVGQNGMGAVSNALDTGDIIDGGAGRDTVVATMIQSNEVDGAGANLNPMPRTNSVEEFRLQALEDVTLDADHITGEDHYASVDSRADLTITNVDITDTQITKDITIEMKDTQQNSDLAVYFNEKDLKSAPAVTTANSEFFIQVADGIATQDEPLANLEFDLSFTQGADTYSFEGLTAATYEELVNVIKVAFATEGLADYTVELGDEFTEVEFLDDDGNVTSTVALPDGRSGFYINVSDDEGEAFDDITFKASQRDGAPAVYILAESAIDRAEATTTFKVESDVILDGVGRGSDGGELVIGSTSASATSTGVQVINVEVRENSVLHDISTTNGTLEEITLTNGEGYEGNFVLTNQAYTGDANLYGNVYNTQFIAGLEKITATNFAGDIVLGRDNDIVDLGELSAGAVTGNVTYNATLNDDNDYIVATGSGNDTLYITLDDNLKESDGSVNTTVAISTNAGNDTITVVEDDTALENTTATIDAGAGNDTVNGNNVSVTVTAGAGNDVVYAENTGVGALLSIDTTAGGAYFASTPAIQVGAAVNNGTIHFLDGRTVTVTVATDGAAAGILTNGYESAAVEITASSGTLTTLADLNAAVLKAINEDDVLNKIVEAYVDENNNVAVRYLVDGVQSVAGIELTVSNPTGFATATASAAMLNEYRDFVNDSTVAAATVNGLLQADLSTTTASSANHEGSTIAITAGANTGLTQTVTIGDDVITYTGTGVDNTDAMTLANALNAAGYYADGVTVAGTVSVITAQEVLFSGNVATANVTDNVALNQTNITSLLGVDSVDNDNVNVVNGGAGDDVIVLSSEDTLADTVVWTEYNQGNDTIVHFVTGTDKLDFTSYLIGTVDANDSGSTSDESEIALTITTAANDTFTANSINLINFTADLSAITTETFDTLTANQVEALLEADASANTVLTAAPGDLYQANGVSVLVIHDDTAATGNDGAYKAFEVTYADATAAAGATDFTVKLIGSFDLGDGTLVVGDFTV